MRQIFTNGTQNESRYTVDYLSIKTIVFFIFLIRHLQQGHATIQQMAKLASTKTH